MTRVFLGLVIGLVIGGLISGLGGHFLAVGTHQPELVSQAPDQNPDLSVTLSDGLMTTLVRQSVARGDAPVALDSVRVASQEGKLIVAGDIPLVVGRAAATVEMAPVVESGRLRMRVLSASLGSLRVPVDLGRLLEGPINQHLDRLTGDFNATITGAHAGGEGLTVTARVSPTLR